MRLSKVADDGIYLVEGKTLNALIRAQNQVEGMKLQPAEVGTVTPSDLNLVLDLSPLAKRVEELEENGGGRSIPFSFTAAGTVPTNAEMKAGIEAAYAAEGVIPRGGDLLYSNNFDYEVRQLTNIAGDGISNSAIWRVRFDVGGVTYVAFNRGPLRLYTA